MGQSGARRFAGLDNDIMQAEQEQTALEKRLKTQYPKYYALKYPQPVDLPTLQNQVLQKGEMILVYAVLNSRIEKKTILLGNR